MHQQMLLSISSNSLAPGQFLGVEVAVNQSSASATLNVPAAAVAGCLLVAILRCRGDRTFSTPAGWTLVRQTLAPMGQVTPGTGNTWLYVFTKLYAGEASITFTQSTSAAYAFALMAVTGSLISEVYVDSTSGTISKVNASSILISAALWNGLTNASVTMGSFTNRGITYNFTSPNYFFVAQVFSRSGIGAGSYGVGTSPSGANYVVWAAEIG